MRAYLRDDVVADTIHAQVQAAPFTDTVPDMWLLSSSGQSGLFAAHVGAAFSFAHFITPNGGPKMVEMYREVASSLMDVYLSSVGNRMNEIMKFLTVMTSIFIPLTFIAGVYGMNFNTEKSPWNMPELNSEWGYVICMGIMAGIAVSLLVVFWRKGWFDDYSGRRGARERR